MTLQPALALVRAAAHLSSHVDSALARIGIDFADMRRLRAIGAADGGISRSELAATMAESPSQTVRATRPLEKLGWVEGNGGRFGLSASGRRLLESAEEIACPAAARWFAEHGSDVAVLGPQSSCRSAPSRC
ncbi:hypothetical protein [Amycolatopsis sp. MtRt-6]|uniref:hypothetical protein n=1 Tax=Amycolatopsis sp. MtRt-6 TaxID=2792782 RepID=UPI001A8D6429|nr:hypothetical protein [Amycolatopsis sp. MtRt-6]